MQRRYYVIHIFNAKCQQSEFAAIRTYITYGRFQYTQSVEINYNLYRNMCSVRYWFFFSPEYGKNWSTTNALSSALFRQTASSSFSTMKHKKIWIETITSTRCSYRNIIRRTTKCQHLPPGEAYKQQQFSMVQILITISLSRIK